MTDFDNIAVAVLLFVAAIGLLLMVGLFSNLSTNLESKLRLLSDNSSIEDGLAGVQSLNTVVDRTDSLFVALFIGTVISIIVTGFFIGGHPIMTFVYFLFIVVGVAVSMILRYIFEQFVAHDFFAAAVVHLPAMNYIMSNLPLLMAGVGILGVIAFFSRPSGQDVKYG